MIQPSPVRWLVIDATRLPALDFSAGRAVAELQQEPRQTGVVLALVVLPVNIGRISKRMGLIDLIGANRIFDSRHACLAATTRNVLLGSDTQADRRLTLLPSVPILRAGKRGRFEFAKCGKAIACWGILKCRYPKLSLEATRGHRNLVWMSISEVSVRCTGHLLAISSRRELFSAVKGPVKHRTSRSILSSMPSFISHSEQSAAWYLRMSKPKP